MYETVKSILKKKKLFVSSIFSFSSNVSNTLLTQALPWDELVTKSCIPDSSKFKGSADDKLAQNLKWFK